MKHYYGLTSLNHAKKLVAEVVDKLGGNEFTEQIMMGTGAAETRCGTYPDDNPEILGVGWLQHDEINLVDIKQEGEQRHFDVVKRVWGYDIPTIELKDLAYDPLLSAICCRLSYKRIPEAIPHTIKEQGAYWKKHYNKSGKGSAKHYIKSVEELL